MGRVNKKLDKAIYLIAVIGLAFTVIFQIATKGIHFSASMEQIISVLPLLIILVLVFIIMKLEPDLIKMKSFLLFAGLLLFMLLLNFMGIGWFGGGKGPGLPNAGGIPATTWIICALLVIIAILGFSKIRGRKEEVE